MINKELTKEEVLNQIIKINNEVETKINSNLRKNTGSYYTSMELSIFMMEEFFNNVSKDYIINLDKKTFLEPCLGVGSFVFAYLITIDKLKLPKEKIKKILNNIYVCEINEQAIEEYKKLLKQFVYTFFKIELGDNYFKDKIAKGILFDITNSEFTYVDINNVFPNVMKNGGFDIIATNPPYKKLKAEISKYDNKEEFEFDKKVYEKISKVSSKIFEYSVEGVINLYKLFVEEIICKYSNKVAKIALLVPNTILSDKTCEKLRTHILNNYQIVSINMISENNPFINAKQALCTMLIDKSKKTDSIRINKDLCSKKGEYVNVKIAQILNNSTGNAIFAMNEKEYKLLNKFQEFPKIGELDFIINMRGEFDLTIHKKYIQEKGKLKLIRGRNIGYYFLNINDSIEYVSEDFLIKCNKRNFILSERLACQQISNMDKERRINYTIIPPKHILGNSCNYIYVSRNKYNIDLYYMIGLLNSNIMNWYFKLISSNNHVNNYEIDTFPIPINFKRKSEISKLAKEYMKEKDEELLKKIDNLVYESFEIEANEEKTTRIVKEYYKDIKHIIPEMTIKEAKEIMNLRKSFEMTLTKLNIELSKFDKKVCETITQKYKKINNNEVLNHSTFKLSELDLKMIRSVPPGGNWKDIPQEIVEQSKRLSKLVKTGGRTTFYGRIDYNKPSYTITTYFNRPGNGTYIHPNIDRVLSVREASRLQSFKDDYYFYGNKTDLLKQVGNAVPPILAKEIGKSIVNRLNNVKSIDLFCGAGGMTAGFKEAGIESILGNDSNESACITFKANNPEIQVICDDITQKNVKQKIIEVAKENQVDMICGGPPCQGFSYAGKRFIDDPRNQLFKDFVEIVKKVKPKIVVMENVEGILTFDKGNIYKQIHKLYKDLEYKIEGRVLLASNYGVPQKRKRVIIICVRNDINVLPEELFPVQTTLNENEQITAYEAISDLELVECGDNVKYNNSKVSNYIKMLKSMYKEMKKRSKRI